MSSPYRSAWSTSWWPASPDEDVFRASRIALTAAFIALAVTLGFLLAPVPNVELVTLTVFLGGAATGVVGGGIIGALTALLHSGLNPLGLPFPLVLLGQVLGMAVAGVAGAWIGRRVQALAVWKQTVLLGLIGFGLTLCYQLLVNIGFGIHYGPIIPAVVSGIAFTGLHLVANTIAFAALGGAGLRVLAELGQLERRS